MSRLSAVDLHAGYLGRDVLDAVTLAVHPGELLAIIGPNGAGKSTLLRALARQLRPASGTVTLDDVAVWSRSPGWVARHVGLTVSDRPAARPLTVREAVTLGRAPHRGWLLPFTAEDRAAVDTALGRAGLTPLADRPVGELSDGEAQRVGLARALAQEPRVLLVDEPTAHLDLRFQGEALDQLRRCARAGLAVAVALHDLNLAGLWADRVALVVAGKVAAVGSPAEVLTADALSAAYGTPLSVASHPEFGTPLVLPRPRPPESPAVKPLALAVALLTLAGCQGQAPSDSTVSPADGVTVTGSDGVAVTLPAPPKRIVSTAPSNTEIVFALGAGDRVVGVTEFCDHPPAAKSIGRVGGFMPTSFSVETIAGLRPDLILTAAGVQEPLTKSLRDLGLPVLCFDAGTLGEVTRNIAAISVALGEPDTGKQLAAKLDARAAAVTQRVGGIPADRRPTVLLLVDDDRMVTAGPNTFPGRLVELAGGKNLFADAAQDYPRFSEEEVIRRNPDALLLWHAGDPAGKLAALRAKPTWAALKAVRDGRILTLDENLISRPGPRLFDGLEQLADQLHP